MAKALRRQPQRRILIPFSLVCYFVLCPHKTGLSPCRVSLFFWKVKKKPAFPFPGGCPQQASEEAMGLGLAWLTVSLTLSQDKVFTETSPF